MERFRERMNKKFWISFGEIIKKSTINLDKVRHLCLMKVYSDEEPNRGSHNNFKRNWSFPMVFHAERKIVVLK